MRTIHKAGLMSKKKTAKRRKPRATSTPSTFRSHYRDIENLSKRK